MHFRYEGKNNAMKVSIVGASGYSGAELLDILLRHPNVTVEKVFANTSAGKRVDEVYGRFRGRTNLVYETLTEDAVAGADVIFIALPSGEAMHLAPRLATNNRRVIDLGGDFRLKDLDQYRKFYGQENVAGAAVQSAVYGIPEWNRAAIQKACLVANPGCYATSAILAVMPIVKEGLVEEKGIIVSSLSGVSGAGRKATVDYSFTELNESVKAYKVARHQHTPEIEAAVSEVSGRETTITFVPHLIPITRGIYTTICARLRKSVTMDRLSELYAGSYASAPFVRVDASRIPEIKDVQHTNFCDIGFRLDEANGTLVVLSAIDNLIKGAAGQAVQNMNIMMGFNETEGIL